MMIEDTICVLCKQQMENAKHLFFACDFAKSCLQNVKNGWVGEPQIKIYGN